MVLLKTNLGNVWAVLAMLCDLLDYSHSDREGIYKDTSKDMGLFCGKKIAAEATNSPGLKLLLGWDGKHTARNSTCEALVPTREKLYP